MQDPEFRSTVTISVCLYVLCMWIQLCGIVNTCVYYYYNSSSSSDLTWNMYVENIVAKAVKSVHAISIKRAGICQHDLVTIYVSVIRHVLEYAWPVWHTRGTNLDRHLTESIETVQKRALTCIYPANVYADILCLTLENPRHVLFLGKQLNCVYNGYYRLTKHKTINQWNHFLGTGSYLTNWVVWNGK